MALDPSTTSGSGSVDAPRREESGLELCEVTSKEPTSVLVDAGISDSLPEPPVLKDATNVTSPTHGEHGNGEQKYHVPEKPPFANEVAKRVSEASVPDFSKQGKPRGRKTQTSQAIADEVGGESDEEKPIKPKKKPSPKTAAAKATCKKSKAAAKPKAKAKSRSKKPSHVKSPKTRKSKSSKEDDETSRPKKKQNSRAVRMAATDNKDEPTTPSGSGASSDIPADARPAPPHITTNNVYSNAYRHALKMTPGDVKGAKETARKATAFFRQHGMLRSAWVGTFRNKKEKA